MIIENENFILKHIAESGQCFRMNPIEGNLESYELVAYHKYLQATQIDETHVEFHCSQGEFEDVWKEYFDLEYDYRKIVDKLRREEDVFLKEASYYGSGIRILRQEPYEALISFIISQNKNIPAIKSSIERLCKRYGEEIRRGDSHSVYYAFPKPETIAQAKSEDLRQCGLGYRDSYLIKTSQAIVNGDIDLNYLKTISHQEAVTELCKLHGVGIKVANCASLYGLHHIDAFPIDTWIKKILTQVYEDEFQIDKYEGYAGIIQQYMFYYMRGR